MIQRRALHLIPREKLYSVSISMCLSVQHSFKSKYTSFIYPSTLRFKSQRLLCLQIHKLMIRKLSSKEDTMQTMISLHSIFVLFSSTNLKRLKIFRLVFWKMYQNVSRFCSSMFTHHAKHVITWPPPPLMISPASLKALSWFQRDSSPKNENTVINYWPSCGSKPVRP